MSGTVIPGPVWSKPGGGALPQPPPPAPVTPKEKIPAGPYTILAILFALLLVWLLAGWFIALLGVRYQWAGLLALVGFMVCFAFTIPVLSGDLPLLYSRRKAHHEEMYRLSIEEMQVEYTREVALAQVGAWQDIEDRELRFRIEHDTELLRLEQRKFLASQVRPAPQVQRVPADSYTPATPPDAERAAGEWLNRIYGEDGKPNPDEVHIGKVNPSYNLRKAAPWNKDWAGQPWVEDAKGLLVRSGSGPAVVKPVQNGWRLNVDAYPTKASALKRITGRLQ